MQAGKRDVLAMSEEESDAIPRLHVKRNIIFAAEEVRISPAQIAPTCACVLDTAADDLPTGAGVRRRSRHTRRSAAATGIDAADPERSCQRFIVAGSPARGADEQVPRNTGAENNI